MIHGLIPTGECHVPHNWEYADATARTAASGFVSADLNKLALQLDDGTYWRLSAISPVTWGSVGGSSSGGGGTATIIQETGTLDQGDSLVVNHGDDSDFGRIINIYEAHHNPGGTLNPSIASSAINVIYSSQVAGYPAWNAFNWALNAPGNGPVWDSQSGAGQWIGWNFAAPTTVSIVSFHNWTLDSSPNGFIVQGSDDGSTWVDVHTSTIQFTEIGVRTVTFMPSTYSNWRIYVPSAPSRGDVVIGQLKFMSGSSVGPLTLANTNNYAVTLTANSTSVTKLTSGVASVVANVLIG